MVVVVVVVFGKVVETDVGGGMDEGASAALPAFTFVRPSVPPMLSSFGG